MFSRLFEHILKEEEKKHFEELFQPLPPEEHEERIMNYIEEICYQNPDGTWSADGDVDLSEMNLTRLPVQFKEVGGTFDCSFNKLTSLEGAPRIVRGDFDCSQNKLISLKGGPKRVGGDFYCAHNDLTSLEGGPKIVKGSFYCHFNNLTSLEGAPVKVGRNFYIVGNPKSVKELKKTIDRPYTEKII